MSNHIYPIYSYDASTGTAIVYNRTTGAVVCRCDNVSSYVGNILSRLADEQYKSGFSDGMRHAKKLMIQYAQEITK